MRIIEPRDIHPLALILLFAVFGLIALITSHPLYLGVLLVVLLLGFVTSGQGHRVKGVLLFCAVMSLMLFVFNVIVSQSGVTVLFESEAVPLIGKVAITREALVYSAVMSLKLMLIVGLFGLCGVLIDRDSAFSVLAGIAPRSALLVILSALYVPQLKRRLLETSCALRMRGAGFVNQGLCSKIRSLSPLLRVLLLSSVEDSWAKAEALSARAYGGGARTRYVIERWTKSDGLLLFSVFIGALGILVSLFSGAAKVSFFPETRIAYSYESVVCGALLFVGLLVPMIMAALVKRYGD